jgi:hypothetical protein
VKNLDDEKQREEKETLVSCDVTQNVLCVEVTSKRMKSNENFSYSSYREAKRSEVIKQEFLVDFFSLSLSFVRCVSMHTDELCCFSFLFFSNAIIEKKIALMMEKKMTFESMQKRRRKNFTCRVSIVDFFFLCPRDLTNVYLKMKKHTQFAHFLFLKNSTSTFR